MKKMTGGQLTQIYHIATQQGCDENMVQFLIESGYMADFFAGEWNKVNRTDFSRLAKLAPEDFGVSPTDEVENLVQKLSQPAHGILGEQSAHNISNRKTGDIIVPARRRITRFIIRLLAKSIKDLDFNNGSSSDRVVCILKRVQLEILREQKSGN